MADVSAVDAGRESRSGGAARDRAGAGAFLLTVVGSNIALGAFLWLVMDARFTSLEDRLTNMEWRLTSFESRLVHIDSRLAGVQSVPMSGAEAKRETMKP